MVSPTYRLGASRLAVMTPDTQPQQDTKAPTLILLVRHGQTPTTGQVLPGRAPGLNLAERGHEQAARVAERLAVLPITTIYSSPLERTLQTAAPTSQRTGIPVVEDEGLLEGEFGDWTGAKLSDLFKLDEWRTVQQAPDMFRFPNGESFVEIRDRMVATLDRLRRAHPGGVVVCFSHADPIRVVVSDALGSPLNRFQRVSISPCSVSAISYPNNAEAQDPPDPLVLTVNSTQDSLAELHSQ